jgi:hypothetical protein
MEKLMTRVNRTPEALAQAVSYELKKRGSKYPRLDALTDLFEAMFYASLRTEESQPNSFHVVYLDPDNPDPKPPSRITNDRWIFVKLAEPIPVNISNLIKIAKASDPRTSSFAIYPDTRGHLFIWGLVDQGNSFNDYVNYESESGFARPGLFQASIVGVGHLVAFAEWEKIAELKINTLITTTFDVLQGGPIYGALTPGVTSYINSIMRELPEHIYEARSHWNDSLESNWIESLCRLLLRTQKYHHGGAILITPDNSLKGLNIKYRLSYERLRSALEKKALLEIQETYASDQIWEDYLDKDADEIPVDLYLDESINGSNLEDNRRELGRYGLFRC